jgi:glycosyltransferase involved in cell wall biosynthesis
MSNQTLSIINKSTSKKKKYNILTFDTHERYQIQLAKTGHNFYSFTYQGCKTWVDSFGARPNNHYVLPNNSLINGVDFDFILSQSKFGQFQAAQQINQYLRLPIVSLEHTLPIPSWSNQQLEVFKSMSGDINVFISEYSVGRWNMNCETSVIHHSIDSELFKPSDCEKQPVVLSVVNDFKKRDYCCNYSGWERITKGLNVKLVGDNPGMSKPASNPEELAKEYQSAQIFLNTSTISPVPTSLLEAMACGCAVVSTATCMIPEIINNGVNGYCSNDELALRHYLELLLQDEDLRVKMGNEARRTVLEKFSEEKFIDNWNKIFDKAYGVKR